MITGPRATTLLNNFLLDRIVFSQPRYFQTSEQWVHALDMALKPFQARCECDDNGTLSLIFNEDVYEVEFILRFS